MFKSDDDRTKFCNLVVRTLHRSQIVCQAFCLMPTHFHLLLDVQDDMLQSAMQGLNWSYARWFNAVHGRSGHFVGQRYYAVLIESDQHMLAILRYLARNPVDAGLCLRPSDWYWGSYRACAGYERGFSFVDSFRLRAYFGSERARVDAEIRRFVGDEGVRFL
jgi:putative transposase